MDGGRKGRLRIQILRQRAALTQTNLRSAAEALTAHVLGADQVRRAGRVAAYVPVGAEPGAVALLDALRARGATVLLPVALARGELDWAEHGGPLVTGRFGLSEPAGPRLGPDAVASADVVLAPALAADRLGHRLGRGGGYYDRALARVGTSVPVAALLHDGELLDTLPSEAHDRTVSAAVTPALGWVTVGPGWTPECHVPHHG